MIKLLTLNGVITKNTPSGTVHKLRFCDTNNIYVYDTIHAASFRLSYFLKAAAVDTIEEAIGATIRATTLEKKGYNKLDNTPYTILIVDKYTGGNNNE